MGARGCRSPKGLLQLLSVRSHRVSRRHMVKSSHCEIQNRPLRVKPGQYPAITARRQVCRSTSTSERLVGQRLIEVRKATLASLLAKAGPGIRFNEHLDYDDGAAVFQHACRMGLEGIVSKRKDSLYRSGRSHEEPGMRGGAA
jgi:hypothetical protein